MLGTLLSDAGFDVSFASTWDDAVACATEQQPDAILVDLWMPTYDPALPRGLRARSSRRRASQRTASADASRRSSPTQTKRRGPGALPQRARHRSRALARGPAGCARPLRQRRSCCACASPPRRLACASSYEPLLRCLVVSAGLLRPPGVVFGQSGAVHHGLSRPLERRQHPLGDFGSSPFRGVWLHTSSTE